MNARIAGAAIYSLLIHKDGHIRSWLFLAPPQGVPICLHAEVQNRFLAEEALEVAQPVAQMSPNVLSKNLQQLVAKIPWGHNILAEYSLRDIHKPIGVSDYELTRALPESLQSALPTIEEIESELQSEVSADDDPH